VGFVTRLRHTRTRVSKLVAIPRLCACLSLSVKSTKVAPATGGIYGNRQSDAWFGRGRNYQVGDLITVELNEESQGSTQLKTADISRDSSNTALPSGFTNPLMGKIQSDSWMALNLNAAKTVSTGKGDANQYAKLTGTVAVTVTEILANGNLVVRGEKKLGLSEGTEVIQVGWRDSPTKTSGPNGTVQLIADWPTPKFLTAARATWPLPARPGWGTSALMHKLLALLTLGRRLAMTRLSHQSLVLRQTRLVPVGHAGMRLDRVKDLVAVGSTAAQPTRLAMAWSLVCKARGDDASCALHHTKHESHAGPNGCAHRRPR
jgi:flagellar L-ring protein precursor FlgH